jgi:hypothetical protein
MLRCSIPHSLKSVSLPRSSAFSQERAPSPDFPPRPAPLRLVKNE